MKSTVEGEGDRGRQEGVELEHPLLSVLLAVGLLIGLSFLGLHVTLVIADRLEFSSWTFEMKCVAPHNGGIQTVRRFLPVLKKDKVNWNDLPPCPGFF